MNQRSSRAGRFFPLFLASIGAWGCATSTPGKSPSMAGSRPAVPYSSAAPTTAATAPSAIPAPPEAPPLVRPPLEPILARARAAAGGDAAIAKVKNLRIHYHLALYGLLGSDTETSDGTRLRSEVAMPDIPLHDLSLWDGASSWTKGTNGDVREEDPAEGKIQAVQAGMLTLAYLRPGAADVAALPATTDAGATYDRISFGTDGAARELWFDAKGDLRRIVAVDDGVTITDFVDELGEYRSVRLPKKIREHKSTEKNETVSVIERVEFLDQLPAATFARPEPRSDVTFASDASDVSAAAVRLPLALLGGRWIVVQGRLGGKAGSFLLDSGASSTVYDFAYLSVVGAKPKGEIAQAAGMFKGLSFVHVPKLEISGLSLAPQTVLAIDLKNTLPFKVDGILGYDFLSRFDVTIDYGEGWLTLAAPGTYPARAGAGEVAIPFELRGTSIRVPVSLNGKPAGKFELDTGNGGAVSVHHAPGVAALLTPLPAYRSARGLRFGSGSAAAYSTHADIGIGTDGQMLTWKDAPVHVLDPADPLAGSVGGDGNLGFDFLRHTKVTLGYSRRTLFVLQRTPFWPRAHYGFIGATLDREDGKLIVVDVIPQSPADVAGLRVKDEIVDVNGVQPGEASISSDSLLSDVTPGEVRLVHARRNGAVVEAKRTAIAYP